jgi:hypothetical protein
MNDLRFILLVFLGLILMLFSCDKEKIACSNYELRESYSLMNSVTDTETYEKVNGAYFDKDKTNLDAFFDIGSVTTNMNRTGFFNNRTHFTMNYNKDKTGYFQDAKDNISLSYQYIQDSPVVLKASNSYEYKFFLDDDCKLNHCVFIVSTLKALNLKNYEIIYSTYCLDKSYDDVAKEFLQVFGPNAPDTIGINMLRISEK